MRKVWHFCLWVGVSVLLLGCQRQDDLANVEDGPQLRQDCILLMQRFSSGEISRETWPRSIRDLEPIRVTREPNNIRILLKQERGRFTVGYDVFADPQLSPSTKGVWVQKTKAKGVYIFKLQY